MVFFFAFSKGISATLIALIVSLQPILTSFLAKIYLNETLTKYQWIGIFLGFSGASIIVISDLIGDLSAIAFFAGIIGLISSSLAIIWQKKIGSNFKYPSGTKVWPSAFHNYLLKKIEDENLKKFYLEVGYEF